MRKIKPNTQVTHSIKEIRKMKAEARTKGLEEALQITSMIPMIALRDEYGFGPKRMRRYLERYQSTLDAFFKDYLTLEDIAEVMKEEIKIDAREILK